MHEVPSSSQSAQQLLLDRYRLRVEAKMGEYVAKCLQGGERFPVMGGDARTGVPVRLWIDPQQLNIAPPTQESST